MQTHRHRQAGETGIGLPKAHYNLQSGIPKCLLDWMTDRDLASYRTNPKKGHWKWLPHCVDSYHRSKLAWPNM
jgi:hypothetical protein